MGVWFQHPGKGHPGRAYTFGAELTAVEIWGAGLRAKGAGIRGVESGQVAIIEEKLI